MPDERVDLSRRTDLRSPAGLLVVVAAQGGERKALDWVLRALQEPLFEHIRFLVQDRDLAEDILQDVLLSIARAIAGLRDPRLLSAWAYRIATRFAARKSHTLRTRGVEIPYEELYEHPSAPSDSEVFDPALVATLPGLVADLPTACGAAIRLRYLEGFTLVEIAEALEIPLGTAKSRLNYGLSLLRERMVSG